MPLQTEAERARRARMKAKETKPMVSVEVEYLGEEFEVDIVCPKWAMHKLNGGEPSDAFEEEGGEQMWDLYVKEHGEKQAKKVFDERAANERAAEMAKNDERIARLKDSFDIFDEDGSGELSTDEVLTILTRMSGGAPLTEEDAKEFIAEFDRNGDGFLNVSEFIIAMGVVSDAYDADGDGVADMKQGGGEYDGKEEEFAEKLALGENLTVAGMEHDNIHKMTEDARKLQGV